MSRLVPSIRVIVLIFLTTLALCLNGQSSSASAINLTLHFVPQATPLIPLASSKIFLPLIMNEFGDEFDDAQLDPAKWIVKAGTVTVAGGKLNLADAEIESKALFSYGVLLMKIESSDWKAQNNVPFTDSTFGYEWWDGACHYGALLKANGHLVTLQQSNCPSLSEDYQKLPGWDNVMPGAHEVLYMTLTWSPSGVTLSVNNDDKSFNSVITSTLVPTVPLKIRLNSYWQTPSHSTETYQIDYIRVRSLP
jgi:hypothetical protein